MNHVASSWKEVAVSRAPIDSLFARAVWLAPVAYAVHFLEEYLGFPQWVAAHFSTVFSQARFQRNGIVFMATLVGLCLIVSRLRSKTTVLLFLTYASGLFLHNGLFHLGATVFLQTYSPGLATSVLLHIPLSLLLVFSALRAGLIGRAQVLVAFVLGGIVHYAVLIGQLTR
jgi:hypothetical protein